jgi:hypothetical protein
MSFNPTLIPMLIVPMTFLFVLLIILVAKSPKVGAWLVGGLVFVVPLLLWRGVTAGALKQPAALPLIIVPATFLFVLLAVLISKAPKAGAGLIVALVVMGLAGMFFGVLTSHRPMAVVQHATPVPWEPPPVPAPSVPTPSVPTPQVPAPPVLATPAPIWSAGVEKEMDADVYPSKLAALQLLGTRIDKSVRELIGDVNVPRITLFQEELDRTLIVALKDAIQQILPQANCAVEAELKSLRPDEVGVTVRVADLDLQPAPWARSSEVKAASGLLELHVSTAADRRIVRGRFVEKPWIENFATFASTRPQQAFIIARSFGTCTSEGEAHQQALDDARARLTEAIGQRRPWVSDRLPKPQITATDVLQGSFIVDRFAQGFEGSVGKVWRQALLLDVSGPKLAQLAGKKAREFRQAKMTWARMGLSAVGVVVLIAVIYFFLNMATMGYYEWSLRIASVVLAVVGVLSILMVVH